jgi:gamma-glutamylcyclotransferase (GGCT)/AIG2-like uncharacterized protein YtfP
MQTNVFAYGSLQLSAVMTAVTGRHFAAVPAQLRGYARYSLRNRRYPGLCPRRGHITDGVLFRDVDALSLRRLDAFEDAFYRRRRLTVFIGGEHPALAEVYVVDPASYRMLESRRWKLEGFRRYFLKPYLRRCRRGFAAASGDAAASRLARP